MEHLRRKLKHAQDQGFVMGDDDDEILDSPRQYSHSRNHSFIGSEEAVSSLLHLKQGGGGFTLPRYTRELDSVRLTDESINHLFAQFFQYHHPFLPFLDPVQTPDQYFDQSPLLFWTIIAVASRRYTADPGLLSSLSTPLTTLLWRTVADIPNNYFVVKALCLLCAWPFPTSTTSMDPTHILVGLMMKTATGIGLHRPNHTQDFSRVSVELNREQVHDRVTTWAVCNIVSQSCATGYGQPASTLYDFTLAVRPGEHGPFTLSPELEARLQIERLCDKVSKEMYSNAFDARGVQGDEHRASHARIFGREFTDTSVSILSRQDLSPIVNVHLKAAGLHLRLSAFYDSSTTKNYLGDLMALYRATCAFLETVFELDAPQADRPQGILRFATNYILQMVVASGFTLLKLLSSFFASEIDFEQGRKLFHQTVSGIRSMSIMDNDLAWKLAELMVQMWNGARVDARGVQQSQADDEERYAVIDDSLQLKVRCRMSMSLVFDSIWRWREEFQAHGRSLECESSWSDGVRGANPTAGGVYGSSNHVDNNSLGTALSNAPATDTQLMAPASLLNNVSVSVSHGYGSTLVAAPMGVDQATNNYEVFDPLAWMFDGLVDFPYAGMLMGSAVEGM